MGNMGCTHFRERRAWGWVSWGAPAGCWLIVTAGLAKGGEGKQVLETWSQRCEASAQPQGSLFSQPFCLGSRCLLPSPSIMATHPLEG